MRHDGDKVERFYTALQTPVTVAIESTGRNAPGAPLRSPEQYSGTGERAREENRTPNASQGDTDPHGVGRVRVPCRKLEQIA
jgi:hypothetical protein